MRKKRILIVDDNITETGLLKFHLEKTGAYEVREEYHATNALATARALKPDFIILDVCMPEMSGGDIAARIRMDPFLKSIPVVFLTSVVSKEEAGENTLVSGDYHFFSKPVNLRKLVLHIETSVPDEQLPQETVPDGATTSFS